MRLGYFCEWLVRTGKTTFYKEDFCSRAMKYCRTQLIGLDVEVLFAFLATTNILVQKGTRFGFRFSYWLYYFAIHRMHHSEKFATFILSERRCAAYPELLEFYAGIDRRRHDAVAGLTADLGRMNADFLDRTQIAADFSPFEHAKWAPDQTTLARLSEEVNDGMTASRLARGGQGCGSRPVLRSCTAIQPGTPRVHRYLDSSPTGAGNQGCRTRPSQQ